MVSRFARAGPSRLTRRGSVPQVSGMPSAISGSETKAFLGDDAPVERGGEREPAADGVALDRGERDLRQFLPGARHAVAERGDLALLLERPRARCPSGSCPSGRRPRKSTRRCRAR